MDGDGKENSQAAGMDHVRVAEDMQEEVETRVEDFEGYSVLEGGRLTFREGGHKETFVDVRAGGLITSLESGRRVGKWS